MQSRARILTAAAIAVVLGGCASAGYDKPYALIESGEVQDVNRQTPVIIERIDGSSPMRGRGQPVEPGKRVVELSSVGRSNAKSLIQTVVVEAEPCIRYRLAAQYDTRLDLEWKPVLQWAEPIGECRAKFFPNKK